MVFLRHIFPAAVALWAGSAQAQWNGVPPAANDTPLTARELLDDCLAGRMGRADCARSITQVALPLIRLSDAATRREICFALPPGAVPEERLSLIAAQVTQWLQVHKEAWEMSPREAVYQALKGLYSCGR